MDRLLNTLREHSDSSGSQATRFKTHRALEKLWSGNPPPNLLLFESLDPEAPPAYRRYLANRLAKLGKEAPPEEKETLSQAFRRALASDHCPPADKALLVTPLLSFQDDPANLRAVAALLLAAQNDSTTAAILAALALSKSSLARDTLQSFLTRHAGAPDDHPQALQVALAPLARDFRVDIEPAVGQLIQNTSSPDLLAFTAGQLLTRPPTPNRVALLESALERSDQLFRGGSSDLRRTLANGLARWSSRPNLATETQSTIQSLESRLAR
jgi:hypothetical protein